ncbi:MAG: ABC transporter ATP-binding protein [Armatimonadota bacterium]
MLIEMIGVNKVYGGAVPFSALSDINLTVDRGEFVAIVGQSGSGKSTLLNIIGTLDRPTTGSYILDGNNIADLADAELTKVRGEVVGFVFQFHYLLPDFTVLENVLMPASGTKFRPTTTDREEAIKLLDRVGVGDQRDKLITNISGGQQQRVAIARALMASKPLILADEPTGNLDSVNSEEVFKLMREIHSEKKTTFLIVTHDERIADRCDRIIRIADGRIIEDKAAVKPKT